MKKSDINYLAFEGGGGRGVVYLGAVRALEDKFNGNPKITIKNFETAFAQQPRPLFDIQRPIKDRPLKGVSGSSAGAVTAFMLAMGMNSGEIFEYFNRTSTMNLGGLKKNEKVSLFEKFFEAPKNKLRLVHESQKEKTHPNMTGFGLWTPVRAALTVFFGNLRAVTFLISLFKKNTLARRVTVVGPGEDYVHGLLFTRGLFAGFEVRNYLETLMQKVLFPKIRAMGLVDPSGKIKTAAEVTFLDFFNATGVDLVLTGSNISRQRPLLFSVYHTPDFPVVEAVAISMNIPMVFKPVIVDHVVKKNAFMGENLETWNKLYTGLWVDGGMLNNYPLHAFDSLKALSLKYKNVSGNYSVCTDILAGHTNRNVLGFRLGIGVEDTKEIKVDELVPSSKPFMLINYMGQLLDTFMNNAEVSQIRSRDDEARTVRLDCSGIGMVDFASPALDNERGNTDAANIKKRRIKAAYDITYGKIT